MLSLHRNLGFATFAAFAMLTSAAFAPARADPGLASLGLVDNALTATALTTQAGGALIASGSPLADLNGVGVDGATLAQIPAVLTPRPLCPFCTQ